MTTIEKHGIPREEWVRRFRAALIVQAGLEASDAVDEIVTGELESWPEQEEHPVPGFDADWLSELPESAAAENLSYWTD